MKCEDILNIHPYSLKRNDKIELLSTRLEELTKYHYAHCDIYHRICDVQGFDTTKNVDYYNLPFIPVSLFKEFELRSIAPENIFKTITSSGTTGQAVSKIYLDRVTASNQQKALVKIVSDFTGPGRIPMLIIDCPSVVKDRKMFSARGAGILGFSIFGTDKIYALDDEMTLDFEAIEKFVKKYTGQKILIFGFTFIIWQHFYKELAKWKEQGRTLDLSNAVLIHGGGWKKLVSEAVSKEDFKHRLLEVCGLNSVHDYYGMVEQTGCIYLECEYGYLHASIFSDVITRRAFDLSVCDFGEPGIIQVVSILPESYPGHNLLTEDEGIILGEDDCPCGRKGKYFKINGRLKNAEIRGCSDTYATKF